MRRIPELDALRGISAIIIVLFHMRFMDAAPLMGSAVYLFFVLSGYLITTIILQHGRSLALLWSFYVRRGLRIWPIYYLGLTLCVVLNPFMPVRQPLEGFWAYTAYIQHIPEYWGDQTPRFSHLFLHSWTLAIEEQFYVFWPAVAVYLGRHRLRTMSLGLVVLPILLRFLGLQHHPLLLSRCDALALGALLADLFLDQDFVNRHRQSYTRGFLALAVSAAVMNLVVGPWISGIDRTSDRVWHRTSLALSIAEISWFYFAMVGLLLLHCGSHARILQFLRWKPLVHLGTISYGIYLYHPFILVFSPRLIDAIGIRGSVLIDLIKILLCITAAELSWRILERPLLAFKDHFPYPSQQGPHFSITRKHVSGGQSLPSHASVSSKLIAKETVPANLSIEHST